LPKGIRLQPVNNNSKNNGVTMQSPLTRNNFDCLPLNLKGLPF